jgi:predicted secreted Zn-dependent protease
MSYFPVHTHDHKHSSQMMEMHQALERETQYLTVPSKSKSSKKHSSDTSSVFSNSSFSSTRQLLKEKLPSSRRSSKKNL